jgi:multidrug efflux pump subunit AcrB
VRLTHLAAGQIVSQGAFDSNARTSGSHVAIVNVELVEASERKMTSEQILTEWRGEAGQFPGAETLGFQAPDFGPGGTPIEFKLLADARHVAALEAAAEAVQARLSAYNGVFDVRDDSVPGKWEFQINVKERARAMGVPLADLAGTVRAAYYGEEVMRLQRGRHEVKLMVRYPPEERRSLANFEDIRVRTGDGSERPITELADIKVERGYAEINRLDQMRSITIAADIDEAEANAAQVVADLQGQFMPGLFEKYPDVRVRWEGQQEQTIESMTSLFKGLAVALLCMFVLLTLEFRSYLQPLVIMVVIPFGIVGAVWGHMFMGLPLTLFSMFGLVTLTGVVVNDSIVLIDFINHRVRGEAAWNVRDADALLEAGRRRCRPIFLTSVTTLVGLLPLLMDRSFQAQILIPMAVSIVFGLSMSTILVLCFVPTLYLLYARLVGMASTGEGAPRGESAGSATMDELQELTLVGELEGNGQLAKENGSLDKTRDSSTYEANASAP